MVQSPQNIQLFQSAGFPFRFYFGMSGLLGIWPGLRWRLALLPLAVSFAQTVAILEYHLSKPAGNMDAPATMD